MKKITLNTVLLLFFLWGCGQTGELYLPIDSDDTFSEALPYIASENSQ